MFDCSSVRTNAAPACYFYTVFQRHFHSTIFKTLAHTQKNPILEFDLLKENLCACRRVFLPAFHRSFFRSLCVCCVCVRARSFFSLLSSFLSAFPWFFLLYNSFFIDSMHKWRSHFYVFTLSSFMKKKHREKTTIQTKSLKMSDVHYHFRFAFALFFLFLPLFISITLQTKVYVNLTYDQHFISKSNRFLTIIHQFRP